MLEDSVAIELIKTLDEICYQLLDIRDVVKSYPSFKNRVIMSISMLNEVRTSLYDGDY